MREFDHGTAYSTARQGKSFGLLQGGADWDETDQTGDQPAFGRKATILITFFLDKHRWREVEANGEATGKSAYHRRTTNEPQSLLIVLFS
jgi:hypothetical protein